MFGPSIRNERCRYEFLFQIVVPSSECVVSRLFSAMAIIVLLVVYDMQLLNALRGAHNLGCSVLKLLSALV